MIFMTYLLLQFMEIHDSLFALMHSRGYNNALGTKAIYLIRQHACTGHLTDTMDLA